MNIIFKTLDLTKGDIEKISLLEKKIFPDACSSSTLLSLIKSGAIAIAAYDGDTLSAFAYMSKVLDEGELLRIAVDESYRGKKISKELLSLLHKKAYGEGVRSIFLEVRESNVPAIALYESAGYEKIGIRKNFYSSPKENALLYRKELIFD